MPRVAVNPVRLTDHARKRILRRDIPHGAIWGAVDHPFATRRLSDGREVSTVSATVRNQRSWVNVVLERPGHGDVVVITAYPKARRQRRPAAGRIGTRAQ